MPADALVHAAYEALALAVVLALPVAAVAALVGLAVGAFQSATQVQDPAVAHLPRMLAVVAAMVALGPWIAREIGAFATRVLELAAR